MNHRRSRTLAAMVCCLAATGMAACSTTGNPASTSPSSSTTSSSAQPVKGGTLNMLGSGDVDFMDPNISYYSIGYLGLRMWSRQLFTYPADQEQSMTATPDLATELPTPGHGISADGKTYTITLRSGVKWNTSPAREVTAADVVRGVKRTCNPVQPFGGLPDYEGLIVGFQSFCDGFAKVDPSPAAMKAYLEGHDVAGLKAVDDHTVQFTLTHPAAYFIDMLTLPAFSPAPVEWDAYAPASAELAQHTLSDGPYQVTSYSPTKKIVFARNPAWDASTDPIRKAYVDSIVIDETVTQDSTQQQLQTGTASADMEFDNFPPPSQLPALLSTKDPDLNLGVTSSSNPYLVYNTVSPNNSGAMGKVAVRQAISEAINRDDIVQVLGGPKVSPPLTHVLPADILGGEATFDPYAYDPTKAQTGLTQAGLPQGATVKILYRNASEGATKTFQTVQQALSKVGITVVGVPSPNADFYTKYLEVPSVAQRGVWDIAIAGWGADWYGNAALSFFNPLFSGKPAYPPIGSNFGFYTSDTTNRLITTAESATDAATAKTDWAAVDHQVMQDAPFYPITNPMQANYHAKQVNGAVYIPAIQNFDPTNVWLTPGMQGD